MIDIEANKNLLAQTETVSVETTPAYHYLMSIKKSGRPGVESSLNKIARILTKGQVDCYRIRWENVRYQEASAMREVLQKSYHINTCNHDLCAFRGVMKSAWLLGLIPADDYLRTIAVKEIKGSFEPAGDALSKEEIKALLDACTKDKNPAGRRDAAVIVVLYMAGLRREELTKIKLREYDPRSGRILVHGKESKDRVTFVANSGLLIMQDWLDKRGKDGEFLFVPINKSGKINIRIAKPITPTTVLNICTKRGKQAGVDHFSPHDLRRTCITDMLESGIDIATVASIAGHEDLKTTLRYDRRNDDRKQAAAGKLDIKYRRKDLVKRGVVK